MRVLVAVVWLLLCASSVQAQTVSMPSCNADPVQVGCGAGIIHWGYEGVLRAREWVGPSGRMSIQTTMPSLESALDIWPTAHPLRPVQFAYSELTVHRKDWADPCTERLSLSAMVIPEHANYRFSYEHGPNGQGGVMANCTFADDKIGIEFCFDRPIAGGPSNCPLVINAEGLWASDDKGATYFRLTRPR